jgi:hypothetical protein
MSKRPGLKIEAVFDMLKKPIGAQSTPKRRIGFKTDQATARPTSGVAIRDLRASCVSWCGDHFRDGAEP